MFGGGTALVVETLGGRGRARAVASFSRDSVSRRRVVAWGMTVRVRDVKKFRVVAATMPGVFFFWRRDDLARRVFL